MTQVDLAATSKLPWWARFTAALGLALAAWTGVTWLGDLLGQNEWSEALGFCAAGFVIAALFARHGQARPASQHGLGKGLANFAAVFVVVGLLAIAGLAFGVLIGDYTLPSEPLTAGAVGLLVARLLLVLIGEAIPEELVFRRVLMDQLTERFGLWASIGLQAVAFTAWAFAFVWLLGRLGFTGMWEIGWDRLLLFLSFGVALAAVRVLTGSIGASIGMHLAFQTAAQLAASGTLPGVALEPASQSGVALMNIWLFCIALGGALALIALCSRYMRERRRLSARV